LPEDVVGRLERLGQCGPLLDDGDEPVVGDHDDGVDVLLEVAEAVVGVGLAARAFDQKRPGADGHGQGAEAPGDLGDDGRCARTRSTAQAAGEEDHIRPVQGHHDLLLALLGGSAADLRVATGAKPLGQAHADLELVVGLDPVQSLGIGVDRQELDARHAGLDHPRDRIAAAAADTHHADLGVVVRFGSKHR